MKIRICFLCNEYPPGPHGGIGTFTQTMARALVRAGHEARVIGVYAPNYPGRGYEEDQGVRVWRMSDAANRVGKVFARHRLYQSVVRWIRKNEIDLVEAPDWEGWIAGWPRLPVPLVVRLNGSATYFAAEMAQQPPRITSFLERTSLRRADFYCSVSRYTADKTHQVFGLRTKPRAILFNPVDLPVETTSECRSRNRVVFTGTLTPKKGLVSLLRAWSRVHATLTESELHLFGRDGLSDNGKSMQEYLRSTMDSPTAKSVHFHGHVSREQLLKALQTARLAVFPSYTEAFALAPMEAMACACPTIYSSRSSGCELIQHDQNGLLIDPDKPDDIAAAIIRLMSDDDLAKRLGYAGRRRIEEHFSINVLRNQNEAFYSDCIQDFRR